MGRPFIKDKRICVNCNSNQTYVDKKGHNHWRFQNGLIYCKKCNNRLFDNCKYNNYKDKKKWNLIYNPIYHPRRLRFKDKSILLDHNPRTGICSQCGKKGHITHMHHDKYDEKNPLAYTRELCIPCHTSLTWKLRKMK